MKYVNLLTLAIFCTIGQLNAQEHYYDNTSMTLALSASLSPPSSQLPDILEPAIDPALPVAEAVAAVLPIFQSKNGNNNNINNQRKLNLNHNVNHNYNRNQKMLNKDNKDIVIGFLAEYSQMRVSRKNASLIYLPGNAVTCLFCP